MFLKIECAKSIPTSCMKNIKLDIDSHLNIS